MLLRWLQIDLLKKVGCIVGIESVDRVLERIAKLVHITPLLLFHIELILIFWCFRPRCLLELLEIFLVEVGGGLGAPLIWWSHLIYFMNLQLSVQGKVTVVSITLFEFKHTHLMLLYIHVREVLIEVVLCLPFRTMRVRKRHFLHVIVFLLLLRWKIFSIFEIWVVTKGVIEVLCLILGGLGILLCNLLLLKNTFMVCGFPLRQHLLFVNIISAGNIESSLLYLFSIFVFHIYFYKN